MHRWKGRVALVTGASAGIGAAVAQKLVQHGMKVIGCARNVEKIQNVASKCQKSGYTGILVPYQCDLSNEEEILTMFSAIKAQYRGVDVCVNNAGLAHPDCILNGRTSSWRNMLQVNLLALSICTREAYQSMKGRNVHDGHIININSMSGHRVPPTSDVHFYSATKFAVTALTEGLRRELHEAKTQIRATCISPGLVETEFHSRMYHQNPEKIPSVVGSIKFLEAKDISSAVTYVLSAPPHMQIGDIQMRSVEQKS